jgi:hypothetical protein
MVGIGRLTRAQRGALAALFLGVVCLDFFPPIGLLELASAILLLGTGRRAVSLIGLLPTLAILASAIAVMVTVSGPGNPVMVPVAGWSIAVVGLLAAASTGGGTHPAASRRDPPPFPG